MGGRLCEIVECSWASPQDKRDGLVPSKAKVRYIESAQYDAAMITGPKKVRLHFGPIFCVLNARLPSSPLCVLPTQCVIPQHLHVAAVEGFTGLIENQP